MHFSRAELLRKGARLTAGVLLADLILEQELANAARQPGVALLCAMDNYPLLRGDGRNLLGAGTTSAALVQKALAKHNFADTVLLKNPTKQQMLDNIRSKSQRGRPFLLYFLGHGGRDVAGNGTLLAADAEEQKPETSLRRDDLRQVLTEVIRERRCPVTCFVDACESWAVAYELGSKAAQRLGRCFPLSYNQVAEKDIRTGLRQSPPDAVRDALLQPCFVTAADVNERAYVAPLPELGGKMVGVFSHHLAKALAEAPANQLWGALHDLTVHHCGEFARKYSIPSQTPKLTPSFRPVALFEPKAPDSVDLTRLFELDFPKPDLLTITVLPEKSLPNPASIEAMQNFDIKITSKLPGYLVALEKTPSSGYALHFPPAGNVDAAKIAAGEVDLPADRTKVFFHDKPGPDTFKVFLYPRIEGAKKLLDSLGKIKTATLSEADCKDIQIRARPGQHPDVFPGDLITATFQFDVKPPQGTN